MKVPKRYSGDEIFNTSCCGRFFLVRVKFFCIFAQLKNVKTKEDGIGGYVFGSDDSGT